MSKGMRHRHIMKARMMYEKSCGKYGNQEIQNKRHKGADYIIHVYAFGRYIEWLHIASAQKRI